MLTPTGEYKSWQEMSPDERFLDQLRHFPTMLERWRGGYARLWDFSISHTMLTIRIEKRGVRGNLHIGCCAEHINAPVAWENASIEIKPGPNHTFEITDEAAGVRIVAATCSLAENVKPIYNFA